MTKVFYLILFQLVFLSSAQSQYDLTVVGRANLCDGIGRQAPDIITCLRHDLKISFEPRGRIHKKDLPLLSASVKKILKTKTHSQAKILLFEDILCLPPSDKIQKRSYKKHFNFRKKHSEQIRIAYSMFESSRIPNEWVYLLNKYFDCVVVPDSFLVQVYENSGVTIPIFVIPLGMHLESFLACPLKQNRGKIFTFGSFGSATPRKNQLMMINAFSRAFRNNPKVKLLLSWRCIDKKYKKEIYQCIKKNKVTNIEIQKAALPFSAYLDQFKKIDCYINLSKGEGFSFQPREAMALGIPTIVSNNTAQTTICNSGLVRSVDSKIEIPARYDFPGGFGVHYDCDMSDVVAAMLDVYRNYSSYLEKSQEAREWVKKYQYKHLKKEYLAIIKPENIFFGKKNRIVKNGFETNSLRLYLKYKRLFSKG